MSEKRAFDGNNNNNDQQQKNVTPRPPPLKKRFITGFNQQSSISPLTSSAPSSALNTSSPLNSPLTLQKPESKALNVSEIDNTEHLTKSELLERMRSVKKDYLDAKDKLKTLDKEALRKESLAGSIRLQLNLLRNEFMSTAKVIVDPAIPNPTDVNAQNIQQLVLGTQNIGQAIVNQIQAWFLNAEKVSLGSGNQAFIGFTQSETANLHKSYEIVSQSITQLQKEYESKLQQIDDITNDVWSITKRLAETQEELEECIQNIANCEKRYDRSQSTVVSEMLGDSKQEDTSAPATPRDANTPDQQSKEASAIDNQQILLDECQFLLGIRERELIDVQRERYRLQNDVHKLDEEIVIISNDQILKSDYYNELYSSFDFYSNRLYYYEQKRRELERQEARLNDERRMMIDQHNLEKSTQENILAAEMKRLKNDIERIKSQYHHFQQLYNDLMTMEQENKKRNQSITNLAEEQWIRMINLEQKILKKRQDDGSLAVEESSYYLQLKSQIDLAHGILHGLGQMEKQGNISSKVDKDTTALRTNLDKLSFTSNESSQMGILDQLVKQTEKLTLMIDFFENTSDRLLSDQLNWDGGIIYEARKTKLEAMIKEKHEQINKLNAEIPKYAHTFTGLTNEKNNFIRNINASKRANQQQADRIAVYEENTKMKESQVIEKEVLIKKSEKDLENYRLEVDDISQELIELQTSLERNETQLLDLQRLARDKSKALDEELELRKQVDDEYQKYQKKWTLISQGENPASQQLINEVEELRAQFKCSTCKTRTRKCILLSCYHTFCNECIRTRLETRQRRCPSCALVFGASDVKEFYLYNTQ